MFLDLLNQERLLKQHLQPKYLEHKFLKAYRSETWGFHLTPKQYDVVNMVLFNVYNSLAEQLDDSNKLTEEDGFMDTLLSVVNILNDDNMEISIW